MPSPPRRGTALIVWLIASGGQAIAGDHHYGATSACSDCHVMHYARGHGYSGEVGADAVLAERGPYRNLLKAAANDLCLACHDGQAFAPDVLRDHGGGYLRSAGGLAVAGDGGAYGGHDLGSTAPAAGGTWRGNESDGLQCLDCHAHHGSAAFRNLRTDPGTATDVLVAVVAGAYDGSASVQQAAAAPLSVHYSVANVRYRRALGSGSLGGVSSWCGGCHEGFVTGGHPAGGVTMAQGAARGWVDVEHWFSPLASRVPVASASWVIPGTATGSDNEAICLSCHKAHGSPHARGELWDDDTSAAREDGTTLNQTCNQCHFM